MKKRNVISVPFEAIVCDTTFNPRDVYSNISELAKSIKEDGLLQPIGVTRKKDPHGENQYFLIYGFRRFRALEQIRSELGPDAFAEVDVVLNEGNLEDLRIRNLKENIEREQLTPAETSKAICTLAHAGMRQEEIALRLGRPQSWISLHYKVATKLSTKARQQYEEGNLTLEQAVNIADIPEEDQNELVEKVLEAPSRAEARKLVKNAAKGVQETKKNYSNKGRPTAKNISQYVSDASFNATGAEMVAEEEAFWKGVAAGLRVSLGDFELSDLNPQEDKYIDVNYHTVADKNKDKAEATDGDAEPKAKVAAKVVDPNAPKRPRGRPRKNAVISDSL